VAQRIFGLQLETGLCYCMPSVYRYSEPDRHSVFPEKTNVCLNIENLLMVLFDLVAGLRFFCPDGRLHNPFFSPRLWGLLLLGAWTVLPRR